MNPRNHVSTPITFGQKLPIPIWMFEMKGLTVPLPWQRAGSFSNHDELGDDQGLAEGSRHTRRPPGWSPLNDF